mgnify:CR=1 FL=1
MHPPRVLIGSALILGIVMLSGCMQKKTVSLAVPFAAQSPFAVWDSLHEEACEEMSLIMVHHFLEGTPLTQSGAEVEVQKMVAWETEHGYGVDVSTTQLGEIAKALYGHRARVLTNVTADSLKFELSLGHPIIIPASGRGLQNPHFDGDTPFYHMLVVTGYSDKGIITNEPGTRDGEKYVYAAAGLMDALHDWNGTKESISTGAKNALVIE